MQRVQVDHSSVLHPSCTGRFGRGFFGNIAGRPARRMIGREDRNIRRGSVYFGPGPVSCIAEFRVDGPFVRPAPDETVTLFAERVDPVER